MTTLKKILAALRLTLENIWRFCLLLAFMLWQGGFLFYSTVVLKTAEKVLGGHRETGFITQHVSNALNLLAGVVLVLLLINGVIAQRKKAPLVRGLWITWAIMAIALAALVWLHPIMDEHLNESAFTLRDKPKFNDLHQIYLAITTLQWAAAMAHLWCLTVWHDAPRRDERQPPI